jgi:hypothetical protein
MTACKNQLCAFCGEQPAVLIDAEGFRACLHCDELTPLPLDMPEPAQLANLTVN